jgi:predicted ferric reductase
MTLAVRGVFWVFAYLGVCIAPLVFAAIGASQPDHGFWTNFSVALAFVGLAMMGLEFALVARYKSVAAPFGQDGLLQFHRQIGLIGLAFVLVHVALSTRWHAVPTSAALRAPALVWCGVAAAAAVVLLVVTSVWRRWLRLSYEMWHVAHTVLAVVAVVGASPRVPHQRQHGPEPGCVCGHVVEAAAVGIHVGGVHRAARLGASDQAIGPAQSSLAPRPRRSRARADDNADT